MKEKEGDTYVSGVDITLNYVQNRYVAGGFARRCRNHTVFWLQQATHYI